MNTIEPMRKFLGWCSLINMGLLMLSTIFLVLFRGPISRIHSKLFQLSESDLSSAYFQYLAQFKIAVLVFNIVPYIALRVIKE